MPQEFRVVVHTDVDKSFDSLKDELEQAMSIELQQGTSRIGIELAFEDGFLNLLVTSNQFPLRTGFRKECSDDGYEIQYVQELLGGGLDFD